MKPGMEKRITRIYQHFDIRKKGRKKLVCGPYWFGYFQENGRQRRVYVGKDLPGSLKYLLEGRVRKPGYINFTWPGRKR